MVKKFKKLIAADTTKDTSIIFIGTIINIIAGGLFFILAPRLLGPADYGLFASVTATGILSVNIANFGIDTGILRFAKKKDSNLNKYLTLALKSYIILGILLALLGIFISPALASFLNQPQITNLLRIAFASTILLLITNFFVSALQAKREFLKASLINISSNVVRIFVLALGAYFFTINLLSVTLIFFLVTLVSALTGTVFLRFKLVSPTSVEVKKFYGFNIWIALSLIITSIPLDNYLLLKISGPVQAGLYAAPFKILTFVHQFSGNFSRVLAPRFTSFDTKAKAKLFAMKSSLVVMLFSIGLIITTFFSGFFVTLIFGQNFQDSELIFRILTYSFILFFAETVPNSVILYYFGKSTISFAVTFIKICIFFLLLIPFVSAYQAIGAAYAFLISQAISFVIMSLYAILNLKGEK